MWFAVFLSLLSGLLLTAGFPSCNLYFLSWIALIPLLAALRGKSRRQAFLLGAVCGLTHYFTVLFWIRFVINRYGGLPLPLAILVLLLLSCYLALYPACFALIAREWGKRPLLEIFGLPCAWVALEFMRAYALTGFPWANLGYTQTSVTPLVQIADVTGVYGVSWLIVLANTALLGCYRRPRQGIAALGVLIACLAGASAYGTWRLDAIGRQQAQAEPLTVAVIQGNIDQSLKWDPEYQQETLRRYRELSLHAARQKPEPSLLVWPETSVPFFYGLEEALTQQVNGIVRETGKPVLFGSPAVSMVNNRQRLLNRAYLVDERGVPVGLYAKQHLVPFGEYVPLQKILFFVHRLVESAGDFEAGNDPSPLSMHGTPLGVLICYEDIFPDLARATVQRGAMALVNITNDAWFGTSSAPYQHLEMARWRAIEFRVPMIRAANTGISAVFDATGEPRGDIALNERGYLAATVHPFRIMTWYARWGDLFAWLCAVVAACGLLCSGILRRTVSPSQEGGYSHEC